MSIFTIPSNSYSPLQLLMPEAQFKVPTDKINPLVFNFINGNLK